MVTDALEPMPPVESPLQEAMDYKMLAVTREYSFEAAHFLPKVHDGHKCKRMHGHNYKIEVTISGPMAQTGFIIDFWDMDKVVDPIIAKIDHRVLNDVGIPNPTAENICVFFFGMIEEGLKAFGADLELMAVRVWETPTCCAFLTKTLPASY